MKRTLTAQVSGKHLFQQVLIPVAILAGYNLVYLFRPSFTSFLETDFWLIPTLFLLINTFASWVLIYYCILYIISGLGVSNNAAQGLQEVTGAHAENKLSFTGSLGDFFSLMVSGTLLTIITLGIYAPWFQQKIYDYIAQSSSYNQRSFRFEGTGGELFKYFLLFWILMIVASVVGALLAVAVPALGGIVLSITLLAGIGLFMHFMIKWSIQLGYDVYHIRWNRPNSEGVLLCLGQWVLMVITFGIYTPWAYLTMARYYVSHMYVETDSAGANAHNGTGAAEPMRGANGDFTTGATPSAEPASNNATRNTVAYASRTLVTLSFQPEQGDGLFLLGQFFLTLITLGFYYPYAVANITNHFAPRLSFTN